MAANYKTISEAGDEAPWLVLVHGMSQDHRVFSTQIDAFKDRYRLLLIDLPGHGLSTEIPGPFGHSELADQILGALHNAGVTQCHYWATHTGTALGLLLAATDRARFNTMTFEGVVLPGHVMPSVDAEFQRTRDIAQNKSIDTARKHWFEKARWFDVMRARPTECRSTEHWEIVSSFSGAPWLYEGSAQAVAPIDERLATLDLPILLYNGEHDLVDFVDAAKFLESRLPNVRRTTIPEAGGFPAWEFPSRVNDIVAEFLAEA
jgi:3-oxoadipate enol-lactonase